MKESLKGKRYTSDEEVKIVVIKWLKGQSREFYEAAIQASIQKWNIAIERNNDSLEK